MASKDNFFVKNKSIVTFLILEIVALTAFNFGNNSSIFGLVGGILALLCIPFAWDSIKQKKSLFTLVIPLGLLLIVSGIGAFGSFSGYFDTFTNIALLVALPGFLALGFFSRKLNDVKPKTVLLVLGAALAAICLFGLFSTIIEYGLFYSLIYKNTPNYYYNGIPYDVTKEMFWLTGFEFSEVYIEYGSLFGVLGASFLVGLLFISPKKERNEFIICGSIGGVGLLTLLVIPNFKAILVVLVASLFAFVLKFLKNHQKTKKILGISFLAVLGLALLFYILAIINAAAGFAFKGFLNRVFVQNGLMQNVTETLKGLFLETNGSPLFGLLPLTTTEDAVFANTGIFEVELLKEVGVLGALVFISALIYIGYLVFKYLKNSEDTDLTKSILVVVVLSFFIYESLFNTIKMGPHHEGYLAFLKSPLLLVILFVLGYMISGSEKEEETTNE